MSEDEEMAGLRAKRQAELEQQVAAKQQQEESQQAIDTQRHRMLVAILTDEARNRLANIKIANPNLAINVENQLLSLAQSGRVRGKINDEQLKTLLRQLQGTKRDSIIKVVRK